MTAAARIYNAAPACVSEKIAEEFARDLYAERVDPSDPEDAFCFLCDLYPNRIRDILGNEKRALFELGQLYIEAEMARITQDN